MSLVDDVDGTAGDTLPGRLEDEPNPSTRWMVSEVQPGPSTIVVCTSWPQACATPSMWERYGCGIRRPWRASMSARSARTGPSPVPTSQTRPVPQFSTFGSRPATCKRRTMAAVVRVSCEDNSGCACRSRRNEINSWDRAAAKSTVRSRPQLHSQFFANQSHHIPQRAP